MAKKWYVNCDTFLNAFAIPNYPNFSPIDPDLGPYGPNVRLLAVIQAQSTKTFQSVWTLALDGNNLPNVDLPAFPAQPAALGAANVTETQDLVGRRVFENTLRVPDVGDQKYTVTCKKAKFFKNQTILTEEIVTWRRVWFSVYSTDQSQAGMIESVMSAVKQAFDPGCLDLVPVEHVALQYPHTLALIDEVGDNTYRFPKAIHGGNWPLLQRKPFHLLINLVKYCAKVKTLNYTPAVVSPLGGGWQAVNQNEYQAPDGSATAWRDQGGWWVEFRLPGAALCLLFDADNRAHVQAARGLQAYGFSDAFVRISADPNNGGAQDVSNHRAQVSVAPNPTRFRLRLTGPLAALGQALTDGGAVAFDFDIEVADLSVAGQNSGNMATVQTHTIQQNVGWVPLSNAEVAKLVIHEIGHALGLVPQTLPTQGGTWDHPTHYVGHGGTGPHCSLNTQDNNGTYEHNGGGTMCVMYHQVHAQAGSAFCSNCTRALKVVPLRRNDLRGIMSRHWDTFTS